MTLRAVFWVLGRILRPFSALFLIPAAVDLRYGAYEQAAAFAGTGVLTLAIGWVMSRARSNENEVGRIEAMGVVAGAWLSAALLGAVPFLFQGLGFADGRRRATRSGGAGPAIVQCCRAGRPSRHGRCAAPR